MRVAADTHAGCDDIGQRLLRPRRGDRIGRPQHDGIGALGKAGHHDHVARLRLVQRIGQHQQRMRRAGIAAIGVQRIGNRRIRHARRLRHRRPNTLAGRREDQLGDILGLDIRRLQRRANIAGAKLQIAFVADPAFFPVVVIGLGGGAEMVDEQRGVGSNAQQLGRDILGPDGEGSRTGAVLHLLNARRLGAQAFGGDHQRRARGVFQRGTQRGNAGAVRTADIQRPHATAELQRGGGQRAGLQIGKRRSRRNQPDLGDAGAILIAQTFARRLNRHGDDVFIPAAEGAPAFGEPFQRRRHPRMGGRDRAALQPKSRNICAPTRNAECH